jgi:hypothetical protein
MFAGFSGIVINFTNILRAAFLPIFLRQKSTNLNVSKKQLYPKRSHEKAARKMLVILTTGQQRKEY